MLYPFFLSGVAAVPCLNLEDGTHPNGAAWPSSSNACCHRSKNFATRSRPWNRHANVPFRPASDADWETLTASCLTQIGNIPAGANLGFVYVSDTLDEDLPLIADRLREDTGVDHWVGTVGFGVMVGGREYFDTPAMVVLVGALDEDAFRVMSTIDTPGDPLPDEVMDWVARRNPMLGVVHADPRNAYVGDILNSITDDTEAFGRGADRIRGKRDRSRTG